MHRKSRSPERASLLIPHCACRTPFHALVPAHRSHRSPGKSRPAADLLQDLPEESFFSETPDEGWGEVPGFVGEWSKRIGIPRTVVQVRV